MPDPIAAALERLARECGEYATDMSDRLLPFVRAAVKECERHQHDGRLMYASSASGCQCDQCREARALGVLTT